MSICSHLDSGLRLRPVCKEKYFGTRLALEIFIVLPHSLGPGFPTNFPDNFG